MQTRAALIYLQRSRFRIAKRHTMDSYCSNDSMIFDMDDSLHWNSYDQKPYSFSALNYYDSPLDDLSTWINDPDLSPSSPIPIPSPTDTNFSTSPSSYVAFTDPNFSPAAFAALHPLPRSISPPSSFEDNLMARPRVHSVVSPRDMTPSWATQLWDAPSAQRTISRPSVRHSPLTTTSDLATIRMRRSSLSSGPLFQSSSAPTLTETLVPAMTRGYTRRADSVTDDRDATVRRKKRSPEDDTPIPSTSKAASDSRKPIISPLHSPPKSLSLALKSVLRPPKLAPSAWQLYFTDWIQKQQASGTRKLNVAQAAKEAGQEYACLSNAEKEASTLPHPYILI